MNIGIFDSGLGGALVADKLRILLPEHTYFVVDDRAHAPYGERSTRDIQQLTDAAIQPLLATCPLIVLACNTATVAAITTLREAYPETIFMGYEPMIKPAVAVTHTHHVTLLATQATARAARVQELTQQHGSDLMIDTPNTIGWAHTIDQHHADTIDLSEVVASIAHGSDTIIIACTHYIALQHRLESLGVAVLEPTEAVARRIATLVTDSLQ